MRKLLSANFSRIWKDKIFLVILAFMTVGSFVINCLNCFGLRDFDGATVYAENSAFNLIFIVGILCAVFVSFYIGEEYEHGAIRNKIVVGHSRVQVYFSSLVLCSAVSAALMVGMLVCSCIAGYLFFPQFLFDWKEHLIILLCCVLNAVTFSAIYTGIAMIISNKAYSVLLCSIVFVVLFAVTFALFDQLQEMEMIHEYASFTENEAEMGALIANPDYVDGVQRTIYEFIYDLLPTGQMASMNALELTRIHRWPLLSALLTSVVTWIGFQAFKKKDIK